MSLSTIEDKKGNCCGMNRRTLERDFAKRMRVETESEVERRIALANCISAFHL